ncbi:hypothetical protein P152DRAFT_517158 [Eremomyces bilateralis CBS 781.70]|uniref:FAR-17a/AIG1-like protein n=1 Tax=Eremomyces bilateralis CBS 781.70 TaxID=1392243 RepID=A0A6G1FTA7_9PEZI|nr:uncharacterized protein P152DRAFT_517158 [Eremomyces bilateralis CBS 781.70]KAF1808970.1 hypothetical protein P152DRAFT_517158 [Eremomyces bilateralis CBS 781.70]
MRRWPWLPEPPFDPTHRFHTSWLLSPLHFFLLRALIALYCFVTIFFLLGWRSTHGMDEAARRSFSYFTSLTFWGIAFYYAFAAFHTGSFWFAGKPLLARWPTALQYLHAIFYTTITTFPFVVTIVFWAVLFDTFSTPFDTWSNVTQHALNLLFAVLEILIPRTERPPVVYVAALVVLLALYLGLAYITYATEGFYVYSFLDDGEVGRGGVAGYCVGILVGTVVVYGLVWLVIWVRLVVTEEKWGMAGKMATRRGVVHPGGAEVGEVKDQVEMSESHHSAV